MCYRLQFDLGAQKLNNIYSYTWFASLGSVSLNIGVIVAVNFVVVKEPFLLLMKHTECLIHGLERSSEKETATHCSYTCLGKPMGLAGYSP